VDIRSKLPYPEGNITNFYPYFFIFDGVECASMEGLLQSFLEKDEDIQKKVCKMVGFEAKLWAQLRAKSWKDEGKLYWKGKEYDRFGPEYQELLDRAYEALAQNEDFMNALLITGNEILTHSIGKKDPQETILTEFEFCSRLMRTRAKARGRNY